jgi:hypothetical protein
LLGPPTTDLLFAAHFQITYYYILARIYEPASYPDDLRPAAATPEGCHRARCLAECLHASRRLLELVAAQPPRSWRQHTLVSTQYVQFAIVISSRLLLLDAPGWDLGAARSALDLVGLVDGLVAAIHHADDGYRDEVLLWRRRYGGDEDAEEDFEGDGTLLAYAKKAEWARDWYMMRLGQSPGLLGQPFAGAQAHGQQQQQQQPLSQHTQSQPSQQQQQLSPQQQQQQQHYTHLPPQHHGPQHHSPQHPTHLPQHEPQQQFMQMLDWDFASVYGDGGMGGGVGGFGGVDASWLTGVVVSPPPPLPTTTTTVNDEAQPQQQMWGGFEGVSASGGGA